MTTAMLPPIARATIEDLYQYPGKAELIQGKVVTFMPAGIRHSRIAGLIYMLLFQYEKASKRGYAFDDNLGYRVPELFSGRESFSPDVSFYCGSLSLKDPHFVDGPPTFAVEIRSPEEYGIAAEKAIGAKRKDYFEAGTQVVWDIDPVAETITSYRIESPAAPLVHKRGDVVLVEPVLPGWSIRVDEILG